MRWYFVSSSGGAFADGTIIYCAQNTSGLPNPNDPIPADGTFIYCTQDTSGLPKP